MHKLALGAKIASVSAGAIVLAIIGGASAQAASYNINGTLNTSGTLMQYSTFRTHGAGGSSLKITDNVATSSRFGLRATSDIQVTNSNQYYGTGSLQAFTLASNGSYEIPAGSYAMNGRMVASTGVGADNYWAGTLSL